MIIALALAFTLQDPAAEPCIRNGDQLEGELRYVETRHPTGYLIRVPFLHLDHARCVNGEMGHAEGRWIQLSAADGHAFSSIQSGSNIVVEADDYEPPLTAWHIGDIIAFDARLVGEYP